MKEFREYLEAVSNSKQEQLAKAIYKYLKSSCAYGLISDSYRDIYSDGFIDFSNYVLSKDDEYFNQCINDIPFCLEESLNFQ